MSKSLQTSINVSIARTHSSQEDTDGPIVVDNNTWRLVDLLMNGTGSDQATSAFHDIRTLGAGSIESLPLQDSLRDAFGDLIHFTALKCIAIKHLTPTASSTLKVGGGGDALGGWVMNSSDQPLVRPGGMFIWWGPKTGAVLSGGEELQFENSAAGIIQYEVKLIGTTT